MPHDVIKVAQPQVGEAEVAAVREVLLSGNYVSGARVEEFEKRFAEYIGVKYAVAVNSGTAALHIALETLGIGEEDEVIVPPLTFFATVSAVLYRRADPVFADIDFDDLCLSPSDALTKISGKTKAIIPVHLFGCAAKMDEFLHISEKYGIPILEDCAQAHGTEYKNKKVGSLGIGGAFSFFATKHITTGEGGMITTNNPDIDEQARIIRNHGMMGRDNHVRLGLNNRMTEIEAAMGLVQLNKLKRLNAKRIENSEYLIKNITMLPWLHTPMPSKIVKHTYFWCPVIMDEKKTKKSFNEFKEHLKKNKIEFRERYQEPLYKQEVLRRIGLDYSQVFLQNVERVAGRILGLPNHPGLDRQELDRIIHVLKSFCNS